MLGPERYASCRASFPAAVISSERTNLITAGRQRRPAIGQNLSADVIAPAGITAFGQNDVGDRDAPVIGLRRDLARDMLTSACRLMTASISSG